MNSNGTSKLVEVVKRSIKGDTVEVGGKSYDLTMVDIVEKVPNEFNLEIHMVVKQKVLTKSPVYCSADFVIFYADNKSVIEDSLRRYVERSIHALNANQEKVSFTARDVFIKPILNTILTSTDKSHVGTQYEAVRMIFCIKCTDKTASSSKIRLNSLCAGINILLTELMELAVETGIENPQGMSFDDLCRSLNDVQ